jgi:hypothetical protein
VSRHREGAEQRLQRNRVSSHNGGEAVKPSHAGRTIGPPCPAVHRDPQTISPESWAIISA